jgi:hypothetical protein
MPENLNTGTAEGNKAEGTNGRWWPLEKGRA